MCTHGFQRIREALFFGAGIVGGRIALRLVGEAVVRIRASDGAVCLVEILLRLLEQGAHVLDERVFVPVVWLLSLERLDVLASMVRLWSLLEFRIVGTHLANHPNEGRHARIGVLDEGGEA